MRVLLIGSYGPSLLNFRGPLIAALVAAGHEVHVAAPDLTGDLRAGLEQLGARVHDTPLDRQGTGFRADLDYLQRLTWAGPEALRPTSEDNATLVAAALRHTVDTLVASGHEVVLIGPTPEIPWNVPTDMARKTHLGQETETVLDASRHAGRSARAIAILEDIANSHANVRFVALDDLFCDDSGCRVTDDSGLPLFVDDDHVSRTTAETLLRPRLVQALTR